MPVAAITWGDRLIRLGSITPDLKANGTNWNSVCDTSLIEPKRSIQARFDWVDPISPATARLKK